MKPYGAGICSSEWGESVNKASLVLIAALSMVTITNAVADDALPKSRAEALDMEAKDALPLTSFYDGFGR